MAQIIDRPYDPGSTGEGIKSGIQALLSHHVERKLKKKQYESQLQVAKALGLPNAEGLAHADANIFEQIIKKGQPQGNSAAFNQYVGGQQDNAMSPMEELQNGPQQPEQQEQMPEQQIQQPNQNNDAISKALEALDRPEVQQELGPEGVEHIKKILGGQSGQAQQQLGGQQPQNNEQQLYERAIAGASPDEFKKIEAIQKSRKNKTVADQPNIQKLNKTFNDRIEKELPVTQRIVDLSKQLLAMEENNETPDNFISRGYASYAPEFLNAHNEYNAKTNEIAALKSVNTGRPSVFMTQLQQSTKPSAGKSKKERIALLKDLIDKGEPILELAEARKEVIADHDDLQPVGLERLTTERAIENKLESIDASDYEDGTIIELFGRKLINKNGEFVPMGRNK